MLRSGGVSTTTTFSNVCYHTKWVLTKISPFENAKLGKSKKSRQRKRDVRDMRGQRKSRKGTQMGREKSRGKKQQKKKITCY